MDDGGTPLSHFVIERQEQGAGLEWDEIGETAADITKLECLELIEKKRYKFRVRAVNKIGPSPPGELTEPVLAVIEVMQRRDGSAAAGDSAGRRGAGRGGLDGLLLPRA